MPKPPNRHGRNHVKKSTPSPPTLKDLARACGVHVSTVSRALNPNATHPVAADLTEKIRRASDRLGYKPNAAAYFLKTNRSRTIGVVVPDITDPVIPPIIRGIEDALGNHDYVAILANTDGNPRRHARILQTMRPRGIDGLILASVMRHDEDVSRLTKGIPVVTVSRQTGDRHFSSVVHDEDDGLRLVMTHLASLGHIHVAAIAGPQTISTGHNRYSAYVRHSEALGLRKHCSLVSFARAFNELEGERCAEELLVARQPFTAVVCANDRLAIGAIATFRRHGLDCPRDVSITGFNDMPLVDRLSPPLTSVRVQHYKAGFEAAEVLTEIIETAAGEPRHIVLPVDLIVRQSTATPSPALPKAVTTAGKSGVSQ
jgi:LacI family transcriptional regulator